MLRINLLYFNLLLQFPSSLVSSTACTFYSFFEVDDVMPICLYLMNEMLRNLIKIMSRAILRWFNCFGRFSQ